MRVFYRIYFKAWLNHLAIRCLIVCIYLLSILGTLMYIRRSQLHYDHISWQTLAHYRLFWADNPPFMWIIRSDGTIMRILDSTRAWKTLCVLRGHRWGRFCTHKVSKSSFSVVVLIMPTLSLLMTPHVVPMTTCVATSNDKCGIMTTLRAAFSL